MLDDIRRAAADEGFVLCHVTPAVESTGFSNLVRWIESGYAGEMQYFSDRHDAYRHPSGVLAGVRSLIMLAYPYDRGHCDELQPQHGRVARYAWQGVDYHDVIHPKLKRLRRLIQDADPTGECRGVVDTAPLMEREWGQLAGLGWRAKNTLLINKQIGSYFFLSCLLTSAELPYDTPHMTQHCGTCTACIDACPTDAFVQPGVLDATRCISYLTIEHRDHIPLDLREGIGDWAFGCDVCQEVCPWNRKPSQVPTSAEANAPPSAEANAPPSAEANVPPSTEANREWPRLESLDLVSLFALSDDDFRRRYRKTPLWRTRRRGMLRNAAIVLGNGRDADSIPALLSGLGDEEPLVRAASAWALGRFDQESAASALRARLADEEDMQVRAEIEAALLSASER